MAQQDAPTMICRCENLAKIFANRVIFKHVSFSVSGGQTLVLSGHNGSGKSTLIKALAGLLRTNAGRVVWLENEQQFTPGPGSFGLCAPYLNLYLHFSLLENLAFFNRLRGSAYDPQWIEASGLKERQNESLHTYSSGMLQRARLLFAVAHTPRILLLDEPGSNLDDQGWTFVQLIVKRQRQSGGITILATNEERERQLGDAIYALA